MLFFFPFLQIPYRLRFFCHLYGQKNHGSRETRLEAFFSFSFEIPGDQLRIKLFGTNQGVKMEKKMKKGGHCSNFTDYSTKIANNSRFKNHTDNSRNYVSTAIPRWKYRFSSDHRSQATSGEVSTWMGDRLGIPRAVDFFCFSFPFLFLFFICALYWWSVHHHCHFDTSDRHLSLLLSSIFLFSTKCTKYTRTRREKAELHEED